MNDETTSAQADAKNGRSERSERAERGDRHERHGLKVSREVRSWLGGVAAVAIAAAAIWNAALLAPGATILPQTGTPADDAQKYVGDPCQTPLPDGAGSVETNVARRLQESACRILDDPKGSLEGNDVLVGIESEGAFVRYSTEFNIGFTFGTGPGALLPVVINEGAITARVYGSGPDQVLCAEVNPRRSVSMGGSASSTTSDENYLLYPEYIVKVSNLGGMLVSNASVEVSGIAPDGMHLWHKPVIACHVEVRIPYQHLGTNNTLVLTQLLEAHPPADILLLVGSCDGHEGFAECVGPNVDGTPPAPITIVGPWDHITISPWMNYNWLDSSPVDEDKAKVSVIPGASMRAKQGPGFLVAPPVVQGDGETVMYCARMHVSDVDQFWDLNGGQTVAADETCLQVTYSQVHSTGAEPDGVLPPCESGVYNPPSATWRDGDRADLVCVVGWLADSLPTEYLPDIDQIVVPDTSKALALVLERVEDTNETVATLLVSGGNTEP